MCLLIEILSFKPDWHRMNIEEYIAWYKKRYRHTSSAYAIAAFVIADFIAIMLCIGAGFFIVNLVDRHFINFKSFVMYWVYLPFFLVVYSFFRLYPGFMLSPPEQIRNFFIANAICFIGIAISIAVETDGRSYIAIAFLVSLLFASFVLPLSRRLVVSVALSKMRFWRIPAVIFGGDNEKTRQVIDDLQENIFYGYAPAVIVSRDGSSWREYRDVPVLIPHDGEERLCKELKIKMAIILTTSRHSEEDIGLMRKTLSSFRYNIVIPDMAGINAVTMTTREIGGIIGFLTIHFLTRWTNRALKRALDLAVITVSAPITLIVMIVTACVIKATSPGPVFFRHKRLGKGGKPIAVLKFRTMYPDAEERLDELLKSNPSYMEEWQKYQKITDDPRVTPIGRFLRKTSLDELPQIWNIIKGEMSLIGPRPVTEAEAGKYGDSFDYVFSVKPGLSGLWQVSGRSDVDYDERITLDSYYIQNWSIWMDIWLIARTLFVVISGKGAR